jgi:hypothetical protein
MSWINVFAITHNLGLLKTSLSGASLCLRLQMGKRDAVYSSEILRSIWFSVQRQRPALSDGKKQNWFRFSPPNRKREADPLSERFIQFIKTHDYENPLERSHVTCKDSHEKSQSVYPYFFLVWIRSKHFLNTRNTLTLKELHWISYPSCVFLQLAMSEINATSRSSNIFPLYFVLFQFNLMYILSPRGQVEITTPFYVS